jgi:Phytanoyl-CoA dioxygenase (PhyH)
MLILDELTDGPGFCLDELAPTELECIRSLIAAQYLARIGQLQPSLVPLARERGIGRYHTLPIEFDHGKSWPKSTRLLDAKHVADFSRMGFFRRIRDQFGPSAAISHDELNWRLVRPNQPSDVGPVHADKWFWDAGYGYGSMPAGYDRFKIWMAIHTEPGANGLCVKPDSHEREWRHHFEEKDGVRKPVFDENPDELGMELLPLAAGGMVMFHDELLHGGAVNRGTTCRVSIELTVLFDREDALARAAEMRNEPAVA